MTSIFVVTLLWKACFSIFEVKEGGHHDSACWINTTWPSDKSLDQDGKLQDQIMHSFSFFWYQQHNLHVSWLYPCEVFILRIQLLPSPLITCFFYLEIPGRATDICPPALVEFSLPLKGGEEGCSSCSTLAIRSLSLQHVWDLGEP